MKRRERHVVIGAGIAGCLSALFRRQAGFEVLLLERERGEGDAFPLCVQTSNIVSENHSGAEYPFDAQSACDCLDGRIKNERFFTEAIYGGKDYSRVIASRSMIDAGVDILSQCRRNMCVIREHYSARCQEDPRNAVFGDPSEVCREIPHLDGVRDVAGAFLTPQRGLNPVLVTAVLEAELKRTGVQMCADCEVRDVRRLSDGRFRIEIREGGARRPELIADQVSLCSAAHSFETARRMNPDLAFPPVFLALREILYVSLPDGTEKTFTCLKLEDQYGGMMSPLNRDVAMVYYPPAAHIFHFPLDASAAFPRNYIDALAHGHAEQDERARQTLHAVRQYYPELRRSEILGIYLKVAINTVADSRIRRNLGVFQVLPGCTMTVLPKWTMCVANALQELELVLVHSRATRNLEPQEAELRRVDADEYRLPAPDLESLHGRAIAHAANMRVPAAVASPMQEGVRS